MVKRKIMLALTLLMLTISCTKQTPCPTWIIQGYDSIGYHVEAIEQGTITTCTEHKYGDKQWSDSSHQVWFIYENIKP